MRKRLSLILALLLLLVAACDDGPAPATGPAPGETPAGASETNTQPAPPATEPLPTATAVPPSPTPEPLAATVNGEPITLAEYEAALARQEQGEALVVPGSVATGDAANLRTRVLDMLIEQVLIEQAAAAYGISVAPERVDAEIASYRSQEGADAERESFDAWLAANMWTEESFREALAQEMLTEQVATLVTADVPLAVPQVWARYLQVDDPALAQSLREQLVAEDGADFATLAQEYSLDESTADDGGDLGYFARGMLQVPALEEAAFALEPGEVSEVIAAPVPGGDQATYYLVQVVDIDPERPLPPRFRPQMLEERFEAWLAEQWAQAEIVRFVET